MGSGGVCAAGSGRQISEVVWGATLIPFLNQAKHDAQGKSSPTEGCHLDQRERSRYLCEISPRDARRNDKQTRFTFVMEMELFGAALEEQKKLEGWIEDIVEMDALIQFLDCRVAGLYLVAAPVCVHGCELNGDVPDRSKYGKSELKWN